MGREEPEGKPHNYKTIYCKFYAEGIRYFIEAIVSWEKIVHMRMREEKKGKKSCLKNLRLKGNKVMDKVIKLNGINTINRCITIRCTSCNNNLISLDLEGFLCLVNNCHIWVVFK